MRERQSYDRQDHESTGDTSAHVGKRTLLDGVIARQSDGGEADLGGGEAVAHAASQSGSALPSELRTRAEGSLGVDLGAARVHTGAPAAEAAQGLSARAYTLGQDIYFGAGQYAPGSADGDRLIAHELVHVAQQQGGGEAPQRMGLDVTSVHEPAEHEADQGAAAILSGAPFSVHERPTGIAREALSGNPAERPDRANPGTNLTTTRPVTPGDAANAPGAAPAAGTEARAANVRVVATAAAPLHLEPPVCPLPTRIYEESAEQTSPAPTGFTTVTSFNGTMAAPMVEQVADNAIYIGGRPTADDVQQGGIGDCYLMAALVSMVSRDPGKITSMVTADGSGGATVNLWRRQAHANSFWESLTGSGPQYDYIPVAVSVSGDLAVNITGGRVHGAQLRCAPAAKAVDYWAAVNASALEVHRKDTFECARWAPLVEKAYARFGQSHGQYGGAVPGQGNAAGGSGYDVINGGVPMHVLHVFYGAAADASGTDLHRVDVATYNPAANPLTANPRVVDQLLLLAGRPETAAPTETDAPLLIASTYVDQHITSLAAAIPAAVADPDWANVTPAHQAAITAVQAAIVAWQALAPDPPNTQGPKFTARQAVGNACVTAARTPSADHLAQIRAHNPAPVRFEMGQDAVPAGAAGSLSHLGAWLDWSIRAGTPVPFIVNMVGHASSEGTEPDNLALSQRRATNVGTAIRGTHDATRMARHTFNPSGVGEAGASTAPEWRRVDVAVEPGSPDNELLGAGRTSPLRAMMDLVLNVRNAGTDNSTGQRNVYGDHGYAILAAAFLNTAGQPVALQNLPSAARPAMFPQVDVNVSYVRMRNPHRGNEPDRMGNNQPTHAGDGAPSDGADGAFTVTLDEFFRNFNAVDSGVVPRS